MRRKVLNLVFIIVLSVIFLSVFYIYNEGKKQDKVYLNDYDKYTQIDTLLDDNDFAGARPLLHELIQKYPESYMLYWRLAHTYLRLGDYEKSLEYFQRTLEIRPYIVLSQDVLYSIGQVYYFMSDYPQAIHYLQLSIKINESPPRTKFAQELLEEINSKKGR